MRTFTALLSDTHTGHKLGLLNPESKLEDEQPNGEITSHQVHLSEIQKYLWNIHIGGKDKMIGMAGEDDRFGLLHIGDVSQGNKRPRELLSSRMSDQVLLTADTFEPYFQLEKLEFARITKGTGAHEFEEGSAAILAADKLRTKYPTVNTMAVNHGLATIGDDGPTVDYSHHGPAPGSRAWLKGNVARYYLQSLMIRHTSHGKVPPRLVLRGHYHTPVIEDVRINGFHSTIVIMPALCMIDSFGRQASRSEWEISNGMMILETEDSRILDIHTHISTIDIRTEEVL